MSGKSGETRRAPGGVPPTRRTDQPQQQQQPVKPKVGHVTKAEYVRNLYVPVQPSAEQVNIASILGDSDSTPADMRARIEQVMAVVSSKSEEEVTIALHDNDYCVETAIETLLDSAGDMKV